MKCSPYACMGMWRDSLRRIPPIGFFPVEIRGAGPCRGGVHILHGCVRWRAIWRIWTWRVWHLPGWWPDGGRTSTVARWMRRRAAPAYAPIPDLSYQFFTTWLEKWSFFIQILNKSDYLWNPVVPRRGHGHFVWISSVILLLAGLLDSCRVKRLMGSKLFTLM